MTTKKLLNEIIGCAKEKKAEDILALDVSKVTSLSKYFIICSASNTIQVKSITENIRDNVKEDVWRIEGYEHLNWVIIDYIDVVVHIFLDEIRQYYNLERIWFDAKKVEI